MQQVDIAIVGAGIAGLTCAQVLQQAGYTVELLEKSRGVGGRLATRRLRETRADHGTCYLSPKGVLFHEFIQNLVQRDIVQVWTDSVYEMMADGTVQPPLERSPRYVATDGMSAIAKSLTPGLTIHFSQRVVAVKLTSAQTWELILEATPVAEETAVRSALTANALVITTPAPQALDLLTPLADLAQTSFLTQLQSVEFSPCIAVMAGYTPDQLTQWQTQYPNVQAIAAHHPAIGWVGLDSSKRRAASTPLFVIQSTAKFAQTHLDATDLTPVGRSLLEAVGAVLAPWFATPNWFQVHRWRYAFPSRPLAANYLAIDTPAPLLCAGDWCGGMRAESAFLSGLESARYLNQQLSDRPISTQPFWEAIAPFENRQ